MYVCMSEKVSDTEKSRFKSNQIFITQRHLGKRKRSDKMERACRNETEEIMKIKYSKRREDTEGQKRCGRRVWEKERDKGRESKAKLNEDCGSRMIKMKRRRSQKSQRR